MTVRTRKLARNPLLNRRQFVVDVIHPNKAPVSKAELKKELAKTIKGATPATIALFGFRTAYGGGRSTGFGLVYDSLEDVKKFEPRHRLVAANLEKAKSRKRKQWKDLKKKKRETWGTGKRAAARKAKRAAAA